MENEHFDELRKWKYTPGMTSPEELNEDVRNRCRHTYLTHNGKGFTFSIQNQSASYWLSSLPESSAPLVDLGAGFGFRTADAIRNRRDVIAVDCDQRHLDTINQTVQKALDSLNNNPENSQNNHTGKLLATKLATLPKADLFQNNSVAGILLSQVLHFLQPGEPLQLFRDAFEWLQPGGLLVVSTASPAMMEFLLSVGCKLNRTRSPNEIWRFLQSASDQEIVKECPTFIRISHPAITRVLTESLICFSTNELRALARITGFRVRKLDYFHTSSVAFPFSKTDMATVLIAQKPAMNP